MLKAFQGEISGDTAAGTNNVTHGFIYDRTTWTTLDDLLDPAAGWGSNYRDSIGLGNGPNSGPYFTCISAEIVVEYYTDINGVFQGLVAKTMPRLTLSRRVLSAEATHCCFRR